jgi:6-phosphogluconolactonase
MALHPDQLLRFPNQESLLNEAARLVVQSLALRPVPSINLTGGGTIGGLYQLLAEPYRTQINWPALNVTWGDERFVPRNHPDHNASAARRQLLDHVPVMPAHVHEIPTNLSNATACAESYEATLRGIVRPGLPLFDLTLLSLGDDGHIASLLPGQPVLAEHKAWVAAVAHGRPEQRITLTYPALRQSGRLLLIASGAGKAEVLRKLLAGAEDFPASRLETEGELLLLADAAALGE